MAPGDGPTLKSIWAVQIGLGGFLRVGVCAKLGGGVGVNMIKIHWKKFSKKLLFKKEANCC